MKNMHAGHRQRLAQTIKQLGLENATPINQLEYILSFTIPRKDTNPIAHRLLDKFKTLYGVFTASEEDLKCVDGIGSVSAAFLSSILPICKCVLKEIQPKTLTMDNIQKIIQYLLNEFIDTSIETFVVLILDPKYRISFVNKYTCHKCDEVDVDASEFIKDLQRLHAKYVIFAHNHPDGDPTPSAKDNAFHKHYSMILSAINVEIKENVVIGDTECYSYKHRCLFKYKDIGIEIPPQFQNKQ